MSDLKMLMAQREEVLSKIKAIESECEGIENESNAKHVQELNLQRAQLTAQKNEMQNQINAMQSKLESINTEIAQFSGSGVDKILEAIKNQRWFFFKNKPKVLFDKWSGLLWANLNYFDYRNSGKYYKITDGVKIVEGLQLDNFGRWKLPSREEIISVLHNYAIPFKEGSYNRIKNYKNWLIEGCCYIYLDGDTCDAFNYDDPCALLPCSSILVAKSDYASNIALDNSVYTQKEKLQFTLNLFVDNGLLPIFLDENITQLYKNIYFEKPELMKKLQALQTEIEQLQAVTLLSSDFDYTALLSKYDLKEIDGSIIKYYHAVQAWCDELMEKLAYYEEKMGSIIRDFNIISLKLSKKYEDNPNLSEEENSLLENRQKYFQKKFALGMHSIKSRILAVKKQADNLEYRIDEINNGEDSIHELALLEKEERASFAFLAENTAEIIKNALLKVEYFQANHKFVMASIDIWEKWSEDYKIFKTAHREALKASCEEDGIEEEIWRQWYEAWQKIRFAVEEKVQPIIERGLKGTIPTSIDTELSVPEILIQHLETYKAMVDKFFLEERKGIYQKFAFQAGGDLQDKFETESNLYKCTTALQNDLQGIIFNCVNAEDRVFILKWANSLLDLQIDEILTFVADNDLQKISNTILTEFATLKQKNYDIYLADAEAYGKEKQRREKEYNSLIFKMRKDLMKK